MGIQLLTAEEFMDLPDSFDGRVELIKGVVHRTPPRWPRHGEICAHVAFALSRYFEAHDLGHVLTNNVCMVTKRSPDTVRGPDISYYSYERVPKGPLRDGLLPVPPDLVFEIRSSCDRWSELHYKVGEYLRVGVRAVGILVDATKSVHIFFPDREPQILHVDDEFSLPEILEDVRVQVRRFFD